MYFFINECVYCTCIFKHMGVHNALNTLIYWKRFSNYSYLTSLHKICTAICEVFLPVSDVPSVVAMVLVTSHVYVSSLDMSMLVMVNPCWPCVHDPPVDRVHRYWSVAGGGLLTVLQDSCTVSPCITSILPDTSVDTPDTSSLYVGEDGGSVKTLLLEVVHATQHCDTYSYKYRLHR